MSKLEPSERDADCPDSPDRVVKYYRDSNPCALEPLISPAHKDGTVRRAYVIEYSINGRPCRLTLGLDMRSGEPTLATAPIRTHAELAKDAASVNSHGGELAGHDTAGTHAIQMTFGALYDRWLAEHGARKKSARIDRSTRIKIADLDYHEVSDITRSHITSILRRLRDHPPTYNRALSLLRTVLRFGIDEGVLSVDPSAAIKKLKETARMVVLPSPEVDEKVFAVLDAHSDQEGANALRLLLFTGSRKREVLGAKWSQIDLQRRTFNRYTKSGPEIVRIGARALELLTDIKQCADARGEGGPDDLLFPGRVSGTARYDLRRPWDALRAAIGKPKLRLNDLSHWFATALYNEAAPSSGSTQLTERRTTSEKGHLSPKLAELTTRAGARPTIGEQAASVVAPNPVAC